MILYHFTSVERLALAQLAGFLKVTESNIGSPSPTMPPFGEHVGPDVVWLSDVESPPSAFSLGVDRTLDGTDKTAARITVDVPDVDAEWWPDFCQEHGINRRWRRALERGRDAESWWVCRRPILVTEWTAVDA